jgi:hypothetical protein
MRERVGHCGKTGGERERPHTWERKSEEKIVDSVVAGPLSPTDVVPLLIKLISSSLTRWG